MKKYIVALAGLALSLSACQDLQEKDFMKTTALTLTASVEQPVGTRTLIAGDSQVWWEKGDEIKVFAGTKLARFVTDLTSPAATADFTGSLDGAWTEGSPLWAVYPFSEGAVLDGETLAVELPAVQVARAQSFAKGMNLSVARTTSPSLQFYNVGGGLCFTLTQDGITKVVFEGLDGEILAGKVKVAFQDERPAVQEVSGGSTAITLAAPEETTLEKGLWYYVVALPGALEKGFSLSFYKGDAVAKKTFTKAVTVKRSIFGEVRDADEGASFIPDTDENIRFKDAKVKEIVVRYFDTGKDGELSYKEAAAVRSFFVDEALTRAEGEQVSVFAGTGISSFDEIRYFTGVTKIEAGTFEGCTALTSITIPENTTEIGANAFKGCTSLQTIIVLAPIPPTIGPDAFADTNNCPIIVPAGTTDAYTAAWGEYAPRIEGSQPDNEIWYTTADGNVLTAEYSEFASFDFGVPMLSNVYENGKGVMTFDGPVTTVGDMAFYSCRNLSGITLPSSVTKIGTHAFDGCFGLTTMTISSGVSQIGDGAFALCNGLISLAVSPDNPVYDSRDNCNAIIHTGTNNLISACLNTKIPSSVVSIGNNAFEGIDIVKLIIPESVKSIGKAAFAHCYSLEEVVIPDQLNEIKEQAFIYCNALKQISLPSRITSIGDYTFFYCSALTGITIPEGVTSIGYRAFSYCGALTSITMPESLKTIGEQAFQQCSVLKGLTLPKNVNSIGASAFSSCKGLENLVVEGAAKIGKSAFSSCQGLETITLSAEVDSIGTSAFSSCRNLMSITVQATTPPPGGSRMFNNTNDCPIYVPAGSVEAYKAAEFWSDYADRIQALEPEPQPDNEIWYTSTDGQVVLPDDTGAFGAIFLSNEYNDGKGVLRFDGPVTKVGDGAFRNCGTLREAILPKTVTTIGDGAFYNAAGLERVHIPKLVSSIGVQVFQKASSIARITVDPENVTYDSREDCNAIIHTATNTLVVGCKNSFIPNNIKRIGDYAFVFCADLTEITIPESVETIGISAFNYCENLTSVSIPSSVTSLGAYAFNSCTSLSGVTIYCQTPPEIGRSCFQNGPSYPIYVPTGLVETYKTAEGWSDYAKRILPMDPQARLNWEISYTSTDGEKVSPSFARYNIPADVAFGGALVVFNSYKDGQGKILFDRDVTELMNSFQLCTNLKTISLPESVTYIGAYTFAGCTNLTGTIKIPQGQVKISNALFSDCSSLEGVVIPEGVTSIGARVFSGCTSLTELTFPSSLKAISNSVASGCSGLTRITVLAETPPTGSSSMFTGSNCPIYVPAASVADYKAAAYWSDYADRIQALP